MPCFAEVAANRDTTFPHPTSRIRAGADLVASLCSSERRYRMLGLVDWRHRVRMSDLAVKDSNWLMADSSEPSSVYSNCTLLVWVECANTILEVIRILLGSILINQRIFHKFYLKYAESRRLGVRFPRPIILAGISASQRTTMRIPSVRNHFAMRRNSAGRRSTIISFVRSMNYPYSVVTNV
ncbi:hypothetical protein BJ742DRAFT_485559 [Cladochytrium replicatum]|nr:hypothetical protein BJ742DRAFT_485559 [Cladochytrium replicatum]